MKHAGNVRKHVENYFYGTINHFYKIDGNVTYNGSVSYNGDVHSSKEQQPNGFTDEQIARALEAVCGEGRPVNEKRKWAAVYWCLRWYCNYPVKGSEFCSRVARLPFTKRLKPECDNDNIRRLIMASFMEQDARQIDNVKPEKKDEDFFAECKVVVQALAQELGNAALLMP